MTNLERIRREKHMTQTALALAAGVSQPYLFDLENGNRNAKPETWQRIADALGCTVEELRGEEEKGA